MSQVSLGDAASKAVGSKSLEHLQTDAMNARNALTANPDDGTLQAAVDAADAAVAAEKARLAEKGEGGGKRRRSRSQKQRGGGSKRNRSAKRRRNKKSRKGGRK